jgi:alpha-glucosidase
MLRFVFGADRLPVLSFAAPDAPQWLPCGDSSVVWAGSEFRCSAAARPVLEGSARLRPCRIDFELGDARLFGFGAANGRVDRNDSRFRMMTLDTLLYGIPGSSYTAFPFFIAQRAAGAIGVLLATTEPLDVTIGGGRVTLAAAADAPGAPLDVVVMRGTVSEIVQDLSALVGRTFLPPAWALGFHQSRWSYKSAAAVVDVARNFRRHGLAADVIHLDIHYMDRFRVFTWDPRRFADPSKMHRDLAALGFRTLAIVDPGVSAAPYPAHDTLRAGDMLLQRSDGTPYLGRVWPGDTVFPDFTLPRVREAWGRLHRPLVNAGVAGIWNDMNDPVLQAGVVYDPLAEDVHHHGVPHRQVRNLYANGMAEATVAGLRELRPGKRPFVLTRSGFLGIQRHAAVWTGDNHSTWQHLRENLNMVLNLGLSGVPISGADVGGFGRGPGIRGAIKALRPSAELYVRWLELGSLMPFFRVHCTQFTPRREPWCFGRRTLDLARRVLARRYRLLPLLYRLALEAHRTGLPIVRPVFMHYDVPPGAGDDQFLLGDRVLAAPVLVKGTSRREVWFPAGEWIDWRTGETFTGPHAATVDAALGDTPLFVRAGTALFTAQPGRNAEATLRGPIALEIHPPGAGQPGFGSLFLDDGESESAARFLLDVDVREVDGELHVALDPTEATFAPTQTALELRLPAGYRAVRVDGADLELLQPVDLAAEDRQGSRVAARIPLQARRVVAAC